jgi:hypothetical protein
MFCTDIHNCHDGEFQHCLGLLKEEKRRRKRRRKGETTCRKMGVDHQALSRDMPWCNAK